MDRSDLTVSIRLVRTHCRPFVWLISAVAILAPWMVCDRKT